MKRKRNLKKLLNQGFLDYTNITPKIGDLDMPYVQCNVVPDIDYLASYSQPSTYFHTNNTAVSFFEYDSSFDGMYGLWNGIYYGNKELQEFYIERFQGVQYFIAPDYSKCGDSHEAENYHRQFRSRIVSIWLAMNLHAVVIPLVSCANASGMKYMLDGMESCKTVAFNAKGALGNPRQLEVFLESVRHTIDRLNELQMIIVYTSSPDTEKVLGLFQYAIDAGVSVAIPDNMLQTRNRILGGDHNGCNH